MTSCCLQLLGSGVKLLGLVFHLHISLLVVDSKFTGGSKGLEMESRPEILTEDQ